MSKTKARQMVFLLGIFFICLSYLGTYIFWRMEEEDTQGILVREKRNASSVNSSFTVEDMKKVKKLLKPEALAYSAERNISFAYNNKVHPIKIVGINGDYTKFNTIQMKYGNIFMESQQQKQILIEDTLAWEIFGTENVVDMSLTIENIKYKIIGVYRNRAFLNFYASPKESILYVPIQVFIEAYPKARISGLQIRLNERSTVQEVEGLKDTFQMMGKDPFQYDFIDPFVIKEVFHQGVLWNRFIIGIIVISILAMKIRYTIKSGYEEFLKIYKSQYFWEVIKSKKLSICKLLIKVIGLIIVIVGITKYIGFQIYIPQKEVLESLLPKIYIHFVFMILGFIGMVLSYIGLHTIKGDYLRS